MIIKLFGILADNTLGNEETFALQAKNLQGALSLLKLQKGDNIVEELLANKYIYILGKTTNKEDLVPLAPEVIFSPFGEYDILFIFPEISGEIPVPFILAYALASAVAIAVDTAAIILAAVGNMIIAVAVGAIVQALSPTPEFGTDPSVAKNSSNLFQGAPLVEQQGGSVPLVFGNPYCGGVLISSGVQTA